MVKIGLWRKWLEVIPGVTRSDDDKVDNLVSHEQRLVREGVLIRRKGRPRPRLNHEEDVESDDFYRWLGYGLEMGREFFRRRAVMETLGVPET